MDCLSPILVKNNLFGILPNEYQYHRVPCGTCEACVKRKQSHWFTRLKFHQKDSYYSCFVTLTYDDSHLPAGQNVSKKDVQDYHKRLRSVLNDPTSFKYFLTAEYGPNTLRPHYHAIYFGIPPSEWCKIEDSWHNGFCLIEEVNDNRLRYVCGYIIEKLFVPPGREPIFNLISKKLGASYVDKYAGWHNADDIVNRSYVPYHGLRLALPRYYKEKLYSKAQRKRYADKMSEDAERRVAEGIEAVGRDEYYRIRRSDIDAFRQKVNKIHKKKKTSNL